MNDWAKQINRKRAENERMAQLEKDAAPLHWSVYLITGIVVAILLLTRALK